MTIPLAIAAPAAVASLAYLNARTQFGHDYSQLRALLRNALNTSSLEKKDKVNAFYLLESHAKAKTTADHPFLVYEGTTWTYKEAYDIVLKYAAWLKTNYAIAPKEVVALDFMNSPRFIWVWFSLWSLGAFPAFINYNLTSKPLLHCIKTSTARMVFVDYEVKGKFSTDVLEALGSAEFRDGKGPVEVVYLGADLEKRGIMSLEGFREPDTSRSGATMSSMALLIYTSGTTGNPKPAIVAWNKAHVGGIVMKSWMGWKPRTDRFYSCMPLYHSTATVLGFLPALFLGSTYIVGHRFSNRTFWPEVRASGATVIQYVGETCRYLLAAPPLLDPVTGENLDKRHNVRIAFGNGLRPDVWQRFKDRFGVETIAEFYSATEAVSACWNLSSNYFSTGAIGRFGTVNRFLGRTRLAVVELDWENDQPYRDPERSNFCKRVEPGSPGEMLFVVDPANIGRTYQGYFGNKKASNSKIMRDVLTKGDAWFRTGDVVRLDKEGRLWFMDRIGDTFRWKSENVSTSEVAEVLGVHPAVLDANVYGVELPNHDGRAGCVAIMFNRDVDEELLGNVAGHVTQKLPRYAVPIFLRVAKELQTTGNNKQQKHMLRTEGVDPKRVAAKDKVYWLRDGTYVEFRESDWEKLNAAAVKL
ncbi:hypothetical protein MMC30_001060 [Trapelia coarctata]|nr:hypothetical protein [Trapelia coarctata]